MSLSGYRAYDPRTINELPPKYIRNVCVLAHVDHGKTTLCDHLISTNKLISAFSAGKLRYLDSRTDEQERLITMKSSCITLIHLKKTPNTIKQIYGINLIDSPGHADFFAEVAVASRLCDGSLLLVDVIEGISPQTRQVIGRAYAEGVQLLLVFTKMDRLFTELNLNGEEIFVRVDGIITEINAFMQQLIVENAMLYYDQLNLPFTIDDELEESFRFCPTKGNVIFCSSTDAWAFNLSNFAQYLASRHNVSDENFQKFLSSLWGNFYIDAKSRSICRNPPEPNSKPMIVKLVFDLFVRIYSKLAAPCEKDAIEKLIARIKPLQNFSAALSSHNPTNPFVKTFMSSWLPLAPTVLDAIVQYLPPPTEMKRLYKLCPCLSNYVSPTKKELKQTLLHTNNENDFEKNLSQLQHVYNNLISCSREENSPVVLYVAKFLSADLHNLRLTSDKFIGLERLSGFVGIARIFCGVLKLHAQLFVCRNEGFQINQQNSSDKMLQVQHIYYLQGQDLLPISQAYSGQIVAIVFRNMKANPASTMQNDLNYLEGEDIVEDVLAWIMSLKNSYMREEPFLENQLKQETLSLRPWDRSVTLSNFSFCPAFTTPFCKMSAAILRVRVEPLKIQDFHAVLKGLAILYKADPVVEVNVLPSGEVTLGCSGEVHLEKCTNDLQNLYAQVPLRVSEPLVAIRETFVLSTKKLNLTNLSHLFLPWLGQDEKFKSSVIELDQAPGQKRICTEGTTPNGQFFFSVYAESVSEEVLQWLDQYALELGPELTQEDKRSKICKMPSIDVNKFTINDSDDLFLYVLNSVQEKIESLWNKKQNLKLESHYNPSANNLIFSKHFDNAGIEFESCLPLSSNVKLLSICTTRGARTLLFWVDNQDADSFVETSMLRVAYASTIDDKKFRLPVSRVDQQIYPFIPSIISGFTLASQSGALAEEPVVGVAFFLKTQVLKRSTKNESSESLDVESTEQLTSLQPYGPITGQIMSCVKECCRRSILVESQIRIYEPMLRLNLHCEQEYLGRVYRILARKRGQVTSETLREGTSLFVIEAFMPVIDSFGLAADLRSGASGQVTMSLDFSHWKLIEDDPFPTATEEEIETKGEAGFQVQTNTARRILYTIRKRKGLPTNEKTVVVATKQRTLTKNK